MCLCAYVLMCLWACGLVVGEWRMESGEWETCTGGWRRGVKLSRGYGSMGGLEVDRYCTVSYCTE